jgi:phosphoribosylformylglycinamidine synthase
MALLGWVPFGPGSPRIASEAAQPRFVHNRSGRYESRFPTVRINASPSVLLRGMEGSALGVWVQHGEGRAFFPDAAVRDAVLAGALAPLQYVDDNGAPTEVYPLNPNGSAAGIAALTSPDGRHLAMMPHPERLHATWNWPWVPQEWQGLAASPWLRMFQNAAAWCDEVAPAAAAAAAGSV